MHGVVRRTRTVLYGISVLSLMESSVASTLEITPVQDRDPVPFLRHTPAKVEFREASPPSQAWLPVRRSFGTFTAAKTYSGRG